jgi:hypothetical protein
MVTSESSAIFKLRQCLLLPNERDQAPMDVAEVSLILREDDGRFDRAERTAIEHFDRPGRYKWNDARPLTDLSLLGSVVP